MKFSCFGRKIFSVLLIAALALSVFSVFVPQVKLVYATELASDDFEDGTLDYWTESTSSGDVAINSTSPHGGSYHARFDIDGGNGHNALLNHTLTSTSTANASCWMKFETEPQDTADGFHFLFLYAGSTTIARVRVREASGTTRWSLFYRDSSSLEEDYSYTGSYPTNDTYYQVELNVSIGNGDGFVQVSVDDTLIYDKTGLTNNDAGNITTVKLGSNWIDSDVDIVYFVDDVSVTDGTEGGGGLTVTINDPDPKYYNTTSIPLNITVADADTIWYNIYNGTQFIGSNTTYTEATNIAPSFSTYGNELQLWVYANDTGGTEYNSTTIFGYFNYTEVAYADSGSNTDIQSAHDSISDGGVVCLPAGSYNFDSSSPWADVDWDVGKSLFSAPSLRNATGYVNDWQTELNISWAAPDGWVTRFIYLTGTSSDYVTRFSGIQFNGYRIQNESSTLRHFGLHLTGVDSGGTASSEFRVDHCNFYNLGGRGVSTDGDIRGVVDHNNFVNDINVYVEATLDNCYVWYGVEVRGLGSTLWGLNVSDIYGQYLNSTVFIEDNYFEGWRHTVSSIDGAHYVYRYNVESGNGYGTVDAHGHESANSTRAIEVYGNTFSNPQNWSGINMTVQLRGGAAIFTNNTVTDYDGDGSYVAVVVMVQYTPDEYETEQVHDTYIWNNTLDPEDTDLWDAVYGGVADNPIEEGVDFFLYAPSMENDSFQYNPYVYPHPLVSGESATEVYTYSIDFSNQMVYVQLVYNGTSNPVSSENCTFVGSIDATNSTGWAEFDLTALSNFSYNSTAYPTDYENNNMTVPLVKQSLVLEAVNVSNTVSSVSYSDNKFYWSSSGDGATSYKIYSSSTVEYLTIDGEIDYFGSHWSQTGNVVTVTDTLASTHSYILGFAGSESGDSIDTSYSSPLFQYIFEADLLGFVLACYTQTIGSVFYALCIFFVSAVVYIRQKSLFIVSLLWLFLGTSFIALFWEFSSVAVLFTVLGVAGLFVEFILVWRRGH